jgi:hypothetical protein
MQEVVQCLPVGSGHDAGEFDERLVVLARQQQSNQILAQRASFLVATEEVVKRRAKLVNRLGGRWGRLPRSAHCRTPLAHAHRSRPTITHLTNQRIRRTFTLRCRTK